VLSEVWKGIDMVYIKFYKKLMGLVTCVANGCIEMELDRWRRSDKDMELTIKY
jgi:hypothetical protein